MNPVDRTIRAAGRSRGTFRIAAEAAGRGAPASVSQKPARAFRRAFSPGYCSWTFAPGREALDLRWSGRADPAIACFQGRHVQRPSLAISRARVVGPHDPGHGVFIGDGDGRQPQKGRTVDVFLGVRGAGQGT